MKLPIHCNNFDYEDILEYNLKYLKSKDIFDETLVIIPKFLRKKF